jgi:hypothetical protein
MSSMVPATDVTHKSGTLDDDAENVKHASTHSIVPTFYGFSNSAAKDCSKKSGDLRERERIERESERETREKTKKNFI